MAEVHRKIIPDRSGVIDVQKYTAGEAKTLFANRFGSPDSAGIVEAPKQEKIKEKEAAIATP